MTSMPSALAVLALSGCCLWGASECAPAGGYDIAVTPVSATAVDLFYQAPFGAFPSGTIVYALFRGPSLDSLTEIAKTDIPFYEEFNLAPATTYYYVVQATGQGSAISSTACATTPALPDPPGNITVTANSSTSATVSWTETVGPNTLAITRFIVYRGTSPASLSKVATVKAVSYTDTVAPGTTYYYAIEAVDTLGDLSAVSATVEIATPL